MSGFEENLEARETKTLEETDKKCPSCGGVMEFDPTTGGLACPYCGHTEEIRKEKTQPAKAQELDLDKAEQTENCNWGTEKKTVIRQPLPMWERMMKAAIPYGHRMSSITKKWENM